MTGDLLSPGRTHLCVGTESQHQSTLALDMIFRALTDGYCIVALCETENEGAVFQSRARLWLRALQRSPAFNTNVTFLTSHRHYRTGEELAKAILKQVEAIERDPDFPAKGIVVFYDGAGEMLAIPPEAHIFPLFADALTFLPENAMTVMTAHTGSDALPPQPLAVYPVDVVYQVKSPGLSIQVTPIKPQRSAPFTLQGRIHEGGTITLDEREEAHV